MFRINHSVCCGCILKSDVIVSARIWRRGREKPSLGLTQKVVPCSPQVINLQDSVLVSMDPGEAPFIATVRSERRSGSLTNVPIRHFNQQCLDLRRSFHFLQVTRLWRNTTSEENLVRCKWYYRARDIPAETLARTTDLHSNEVNILLNSRINVHSSYLFTLCAIASDLCLAC